MTAAPALLSVRGLTVAFGGLRAVDNIDVDVRAGTITGLIGPNGAGKTTFFNALAGQVPAAAGSMTLDGKPLRGLRTHQVYEAGIGRTFQVARPFGALTVLENLLVAPRGQLGERFWAGWFRRGAIAAAERASVERARGLLEFVTLEGLADAPAAHLSGGQQKLLELARVLMGEPKLLLLDEPAAGVNPALVAVIADRVRRLREEGRTVLIIEHNMDLVRSLCDPLIVMAQGRLLAQGAPDEVSRRPEVIDAYLGDVA